MKMLNEKIEKHIRKKDDEELLNFIVRLVDFIETETKKQKLFEALGASKIHPLIVSSKTIIGLLKHMLILSRQEVKKRKL